MQKKTLAVVGYGDLGARLAALLDDGWEVLGLRRRAELVQAPARGVHADLADPGSLQVLGSIKPDAVLVTLSPEDRSEAGYVRGFVRSMENIVAGLADWQPETAFFVSSTRVYAESEGGRVTEGSDLASTDARANAIIKAETTFANAFSASCILRAAGLYSSEPGYLLRRVARGDLSSALPLRISNRIHRDDVAGFIAYAMENGVDLPVLNLVDEASVPIQEVEAWMCDQIGRDYLPPDRADTVRGFKSIDGSRLRETGYALRYPDYRAGYASAVEKWKSSQ